MEKLGYSKIYKIYKNTLSVISNNGFLSDPFPLPRGVRQGCPLSLLLYIINGEVINLNIKLNNNIVGYPIPNQKEALKLSQYADDTNFFVITEESIKGILQFFTQYEIVTGATINISKTTITPPANAKIYNLDKSIKNTQIKDITKILGVFFTTDLKTTSTFNWNNCLLEIEKQVQPMSRRHFSLRGKATLLNT